MGFLEFVYLIGCGVSFFMALDELSDKKKGERYTDAEFIAFILVATLFASTSWGFVIYEKCFDKEKQK